MEKRKHVYIQNPNEYEISGCPKCKGTNTQWSEYVDHLWCYDCKIDFIPENWGIFDGPIPIGAAIIFGISFDRVEIATGKRITCDLNSEEYKKSWP